jgi:hypothetical protein
MDTFTDIKWHMMDGLYDLKLENYARHSIHNEKNVMIA